MSFNCIFIFTVASFTDAYDGYYARKYNAVSESGKFLDPLADKILASSAFISFAVLGLIDIWMVAIIILRDLFVTLLRMRMKKGGESLVTSNIAKSKTAAQLITIIFTLIYLSINNSTVPILANLSLTASHSSQSSVTVKHLIYISIELSENL